MVTQLLSWMMPKKKNRYNKSDTVKHSKQKELSEKNRQIKNTIARGRKFLA
jgi:hypothetical protein